MKNKERLIEIIKSDCAIGEHYCDEDGDTCAIGAMARACGVSDEQLRAAGQESIGFHFAPNIIPIRNAIEAEFGLSVHQQGRIQELNDRHETPEARRAAILAYIDSIS